MKCEGQALAIGLTDVMKESMIQALEKAGFKRDLIHGFTSYQEAIDFLADARDAVLALLDCGDQEFSKAKDVEGVNIEEVAVALIQQAVRIVLVNRNALNMFFPTAGMDHVLHLPNDSDKIDAMSAVGLKHAIFRIPDPKKV